MNSRPGAPPAPDVHGWRMSAGRGAHPKVDCSCGGSSQPIKEPRERRAFDHESHDLDVDKQAREAVGQEVGAHHEEPKRKEQHQPAAGAGGGGRGCREGVESWAAARTRIPGGRGGDGGTG
eukprot:scaffold13166_cov114-Isochrysis_galbana.AAC.7